MCSLPHGTHSRRLATDIEAVHLKDGLAKVIGLAAEYNRYLERKKPWETGKTDPARTQTTLWVALQGLAALRTLSAPFHALLGAAIASACSAARVATRMALVVAWRQLPWAFRELPTGTALPKPHPLFKKLDDAQLAEEIERYRTLFLRDETAVDEYARLSGSRHPRRAGQCCVPAASVDEVICLAMSPPSWMVGRNVRVISAVAADARVR